MPATLTVAAERDALERSETATAERPTPIPTPEPTNTVEPTSTPEPAATIVALPTDTTAPSVPISGELYEIGTPVTYKRQYSSYLTVVGVIKYNGTVVREGPDITVSLLDDSGNVLATESAYTKPNLVKPNSLIPYSVLIDDAPAQWANINVEIQADEADNLTLAFSYADFEVQQATITGSDKVVGRIKNTGTKTAHLIQIIVAFYDANGTLLDVNSSFMKQDELTPGQIGTFEVESGQTKPVKKVEVVVSGFPKN